MQAKIKQLQFNMDMRWELELSDGEVEVFARLRAFGDSNALSWRLCHHHCTHKHLCVYVNISSQGMKSSMQRTTDSMNGGTAKLKEVDYDSQTGYSNRERPVERVMYICQTLHTHEVGISFFFWNGCVCCTFQLDLNTTSLARSR